jgi:hypothetical protein
MLEVQRSSSGRRKKFSYIMSIGFSSRSLFVAFFSKSCKIGFFEDEKQRFIIGLLYLHHQESTVIQKIAGHFV